MGRTFNSAKQNGFAQLIPRVCGGALRRIRDAFTARKLHAPGFRAGRSTRLLGLSHIQMGKRFSAGDGLWLEAVTSYGEKRLAPQLRIGDQVSVSDHVHIACMNKVSIGSGTLIGSRVIVSDHAHGVYHGADQSSPESIPAERPLSSAGTVEIGSNVWLGDGVAILAGASIGDGAVIGANSVVTGRIPKATIAVGSPARPVRQWNAQRREWLPYVKATDELHVNSQQPTSPSKLTE